MTELPQKTVSSQTKTACLGSPTKQTRNHSPQVFPLFPWEEWHLEGYERERTDRVNSLPCLYSNNSIETSHLNLDQKKAACVEAVAATLTPYHKRQAQTLFLNVERLITKVAKSIGHVGFLTLTFEDNVTDFREASRRFNSLKTNFLSKYSEFGEWICTKEQQKRGAWHFHLLICLKEDIREGINFEELAKRNYSSASPYLRQIWSDLREAMPKYHFGRSELLPIRSNSEAMARYIGKYVSKHIGQRNDESKGVRLVTSSQGWVKNSIRFGWITDNAKQWRLKLRMFAYLNGCNELYQLTEKLGTGWAYRYAQDIYDVFASCDLAASNKTENYNPPIIKKIQERKERTFRYLQENLIIHTRKPKYMQRIEEAKDKLQTIKNNSISPCRISYLIESPETESHVARYIGPKLSTEYVKKHISERKKKKEDKMLSDNHSEEMHTDGISVRGVVLPLYDAPGRRPEDVREYRLEFQLLNKKTGEWEKFNHVTDSWRFPPDQHKKAREELKLILKEILKRR